MIKVEMKPMEYGKVGIKRGELLYLEERNDGFKIAIVNVRGSHPCGYIGLPKSYLDSLAAISGEIPECCYDDFNAEVHGGFTYSDPELVVDGEVLTMEGGFWLGWDYAHAYDFTSLPLHSEYYQGPRSWEKMYTTEDVLNDAKCAIETLTWYGVE